MWVAQIEYGGYELKATGNTKQEATSLLMSQLPDGIGTNELLVVEILPGRVYADSCWDEWAT